MTLSELSGPSLGLSGRHPLCFLDKAIPASTVVMIDHHRRWYLLLPFVECSLALATATVSGRSWIQTKEDLIWKPTLGSRSQCPLNEAALLPPKDWSPLTKLICLSLPPSVPQEEPGPALFEHHLRCLCRKATVIWMVWRPGTQNTLVTPQLPAWGDSGYHHANDLVILFHSSPSKALLRREQAV